MKRELRTIVILLMAVRCCLGAELFELLDEFRETMVHQPGQACVKSATRTLSDGGGTDAELSLAFQRILWGEGFDSRLVRGWVTMDSEQMASWLPDIESGIELGAQAVGAARWCVPMTWIQCKAQYDSMLRGGPPNSRQWIDVFPGFIGSETLTGTAMRMNDSAVVALLRLLELETLPSEDGCLNHVAPFCRNIRSEMEALYHAQSSFGRIPQSLLGKRGAIQGYRSRRMQPLCPVEVLQWEPVEDAVYDDVVMEVRHGGETLLECHWGTNGITDGVVLLTWRPESGEGWGDVIPPIGTTVAGMRLRANAKGENGSIESGTSVLPGNQIEVYFRICRGDVILEHLEDRVQAGDYTVYALSSGSFGGMGEDNRGTCGEGAKLARELRRRLDRYGRLAGHCFGEFPRERLRVSKIAWCLRGEMIGGMLTRVTRHELLAGACGRTQGSRNLSLAMLLGQQAVTVDFLKGRVQGEMESPLGLLAREIDGDGVFLTGRFGDGFGGIMCADYPFWLDWLGGAGEYDGVWEDTDDNVRSAGIVRVRGGRLTLTNLVDFHDEEWLTVLNVIRSAAARGIWSIGNEAGELLQASVFAESYRHIMGKCVLRELTVEPRIRDDGETAHQAIEFGFDAEGVENWQLLILDSLGQAVFSGGGEGDSAIVEWDGVKSNGSTCEAGNCTALLVMASGREAVTESRVFLWDDVAPDVALHAYGAGQGSQSVIGVEYDVRDVSQVTVQIQVIDPVTRKTLAERTTTESSGKLLLELSEDAGDVCLVQVSACDERQNTSGASSYVVLGSVYAGGAVWRPDGDGESEEGEPAADIHATLDSPGDGARITEGVLDVMGAVTGGDGLKYQLRLRDGKEKLMECHVVPSDDDWHLTYLSSELPEEEVELLYPMNHALEDQNLLGRMDLTGLPNGKYTLELVAIAGSRFRLVSRAFYLESALKTGQIAYAEKDGTLKLDAVELELWRRYSSLSNVGDFGHGWTVTLDAFETELQEDRVMREGLTGGPVSLRCGGSRDVTLTLPDGRRTTFVFSLVYAGGYSYTYRGSWKAYDGCPWSLRATVSSDVTALPGLEPYWNATGPGVPLDAFDFPEFLLTDDDGGEYLFGREHLGDYESIGEDGGEVMLECYGKLFLKQVRLADGSQLQLAGDEWQWQPIGGVSRPAMKYHRDADGRIIGIDFLDGSGRRLEYAYSPKGNLVSFSTGVQGDMALKRTYCYDAPSWPHLLTKVLNGAGWTLVSYEADETGRLGAVGNGTGGRRSVTRDVFSRVEIHADELGNESLYRYDERGNIVEHVQPDGGMLTFGYDSNGKMLYREDALGRQTHWSYDEAGRMLSRTSSDGGISYYSYDAAGRCSRLVTPDGRTLERTVSADDRLRELRLFSGAELSTRRDARGRVTEMSMNDSTITLDYSSDGREVVISDGNGLQNVQETADDGTFVRSTVRWLNDASGQTESITVEATRDDEGRPFRISDSFGGWVEYERNVDGKVVVEKNSSGHWRANKYNVQGICVESTDDVGNVTRHVYDAAGRLLVTAGPQVFEDGSSEPLVFSRANAMEYDACGRLTASRRMTGTAIGIRPLNGGYYECSLVDLGVETAHDQWSYDKAGQVVRQELADGQITVFGYDAAGNVRWSKDARGCLAQVERDTSGKVVCQTDANGGETRWSYDSFGAVSERKDADGRRHAFVRQAGGAVLKHVEDGFAPIVFERSTSGLATKVSQGALVYDLEHDFRGVLTAVTGASRRTHRFEYDELGRLVRTVSARGRVMQWEYDSILGEFARAMGGNGDRVEMERGADGEWVRQRVFQGEQCLRDVEKVSSDCLVMHEGGVEALREEWQRDIFGRVCRHFVDGKLIETYTYDDLDRVTVYESPATRVSFRYDMGRESVREYTKCGGVELETPLQVAFDYDATGRPVQEWCSDGWQRTVTYDSVGRVSGVTVWQGEQKVYEGRYEFDDGGRKTRLVETWVQEDGASRRMTTDWVYDSLGFLTEERVGVDGHEELELSWSGRYDANGNLVVEHVSRNGIEEEIRHEYDEDNCLVRSRRTGEMGESENVCQWDESGQLVAEQCTGRENVRRTYRWTGVGRLDTVTVENESDGSRCVVEFLYDTHDRLRGHRVEEIVGGKRDVTEHSFVHESILHEDCPQLMDYSVTSGHGVSRRVSVLWGSGPLGLMDAEGMRRIVYGGHRQRLGVMDAGEHLQAELRDAWGRRLHGEETTGHGPFGEWLEGRSGLVYLRGRFFSPRLRRFISPDADFGKEEDPKSFNRYAYCMNDPVNRKDPHGTFAIMDFLTTVSAVTIAIQPHVYFAKSAIQDLVAMNYVTDAFSSQERVNENAIVYVHGMAWHEKGWSEDMQAVLKNAWHVSNQDSYEFLWTGFAASDSLFLPIPSILNHKIAYWSLTDCLASLELKGYINVSVVSHSWGTVLSRDVLMGMNFPTAVWATMGSPLCCYDPTFPFGIWKNYANLADPVTLAAPILYRMGYMDCDVPVRYQKRTVEQVQIHTYENCHSVYWTDHAVVGDLARLFKKMYYYDLYP